MRLQPDKVRDTRMLYQSVTLFPRSARLAGLRKLSGWWASVAMFGAWGCLRCDADRVVAAPDQCSGAVQCSVSAALAGARGWLAGKSVEKIDRGLNEG